MNLEIEESVLAKAAELQTALSSCGQRPQDVFSAIGYRVYLAAKKKEQNVKITPTTIGMIVGDLDFL